MWITYKHICNKLTLFGISKCPGFTQDVDVHSLTPKASLRSFLVFVFFNLCFVQKETETHTKAKICSVTQLLKSTADSDPKS